MEDEACWRYLESSGIKFPVLGLIIRGPLETLEVEEMIRVDTGYGGFLLLSEEKYRRVGFHLSEISPTILARGGNGDGRDFQAQKGPSCRIYP